MSLTADFDPKPMAISSIISSTSSSFSSSTSLTSPHYQPGSSSSSEPSSPETRQHQVYHSHHLHHHHHGSNASNSSSGSGASLFNTPTPTCPSTPPPLSLQERRQRNKAASAKYRAKKNQQHGEMRSLIASLTKENELLLRQLDHIKRENGRLKATCDRLRGKKVAANILKRFLAAGANNGANINNKSSIPTTDEALEQFNDMDDEEEDELDELMDPQQPPQH